jgi:O-antigen ligase
MATRLISLRREPGAPGPWRVASRRLGSLFWGTNLRRTLTALALVLAAVGTYFLVYRGSPVTILKAAVVLSVFAAILIKPHIGVISLRTYRVFAQGFELDRLLRGLGVTMTKSLGLFTVIAFFALIVTKRIRPVFGHKTQLIFMYGLFGSVLLSSFAALYWKTAGTALFQMFQNLILYVIFVNLFADAKWLSRFLWVILISTLLACISGLASVALRGIVRAAGTLGNANGLAMVANQGVAILLVLLLVESDARRRFIYLCGLSFTMVTIIFTGSRGGLLTAIVTFAYQLVKRRKNLVPYLVAAFLLVIAFTVIPEKYKIRQEEWFGAIFAGETREVTGGTRGFVYRSALDMFKRSPIMGIGPRTFGLIYNEEYGYRVKGIASRVRVAHSGFLEILVENGLLSFAFFVGLIISTYLIFRANERRCREAHLERYLLLNNIYEALFVATIVSGAFETIIKTNGFFLMLGSAAAIHRATVALASSKREGVEPGPAALPHTAAG